MSTELVPTIDAQVAHFTPSQIDDLKQPLNEKVIKERQGQGGKQFKYITGKTAIDTANRIFGVGKWGYRVLNLAREVASEQTFYTADIELYVLGCPFPFPGQGEGVPQRDTADQYAKARKEAVTDALKRALRHFGDQFGLALYDEESLVEDAQGNLTPVKNVHPGQKGKPQQTGRTVEATRPVPSGSSDGKVSEQQLASIQKLCEHLGKPGPSAQDIEAMTYTRAKEVIAQLSQEYQQARKAKPADIPSATDLRKQCQEMYGPGNWDKVKVKLLGSVMPDDQITSEQRAKIKHAFDEVLAKKAS
jgi:DNA repair and recombination protein RAD52